MTLTMLSGAIVWRDFDTQLEAEQYIAEVSSKGNWGIPEGLNIITPEEVIDHPEILPIPEIPAHDIIPATFDAQGNELTPMLPAQAYVPGVPGVPAWTEVIPAVTSVIPGFTVQYTDITAQLAEEARKIDLKAKGAAARIACQNVLDLISGHNVNSALTTDQITTMTTTFAPIQQALLSNRPSLAKSLISVIIPDGIIVSQQIKDDVLAELINF